MTKVSQRHNNETLFSPDTMIWRVDREMILLLAGGRALLMQLAHPKVAAGVADYSSFKEDPMGRLRRTMNTMWSLVFDEPPDADASLQRLKDVHKQVQGAIKEGEPLPKGTQYHAFDPELLLWVHATLVDSAIVAYDLFVRPLSVKEKGEYYADTKKLGLFFDIPENLIPPSLGRFDSYMKQMITGGAISVGPTARSLVSGILHPQPWILKPGGPLFSFITVGLLPEPLREPYGLRWGERREKLFHNLAKSIRCLLPLVPKSLRIVPHARAAEKKLAGRA